MLISKSIEEVAALVGGTVVGSCQRPLQGVSSLAEATENDVSFLGNDKYRDQVKSTRAGAVLIPADYTGEPAEGHAWIVCENPSDAFTKVIMAFTPPPVEYKPGIHPTAVIDESAEIGAEVHIGAGVVISAGAKIGAGTVILPNTYIGH
ncbi:MAG: hypothetical protein J6S21_04975, partial [Victivallales bacterium]|nr:hypothetical protein [Victivallales bacterium]